MGKGSNDSIYYKILLPIIFPNFKRIIFLDSDTLVFKDLSEMYNLDFNDNYILGYPFHNPELCDKFGVKMVTYINGGVLLINIERIVYGNKDFGVLDFLIKNSGRLYFLEQDAKNTYFNQHIGFLSLQYGIYLFGNFTVLQNVWKYI